MPRIDLSACPSQTVHTRSAGREWSLERFADLETLWDAMGTGENPLGTAQFEDDERLPYWCEIWPSSVALGDWLADHKSRIRGKRCLDIGCGLGLTALIGAHMGAHVTAMDYEWPALHYARRNAIVNLPNVPRQPRWVIMDWRAPAILPRTFDFIWGGDVLYESRFAEPVADFLAHGLADNGTAWIAEPGRAVYDIFPGTARASGLFVTKVFTRQGVCAYTDGASGNTNGPCATVNVWAVTRQAPTTPTQA